MKANEMNGLALAYLGDAVIELIARERALESGILDVGKLNDIVRGFVKASAQSSAVARIEALLTEDEIAVYKRGRNAHGTSVPRSATATEYRRATGLEALFASLYISGNRGRIYELFEAAYGAASKKDTE